MKDSFTQSMDWLHTWGGLLFGWLLFAIFFTGTLTVFDKEITYWMQPELHHLPPAVPNIGAAANQLVKLGPGAERWWIELPSARTPEARIFWQNKGGEVQQRRLDPATGDFLRVRETLGGDFFYRFHYQLHLGPPGFWIVGAAAMVMLVALVTGLVIHRRIFKDFFSFRPRSSSHRAWLDVHNVTSVLVLPFHFVITFSGLVIFWMIYMPAGMHLFYGGEPEAMQDDMEQRLERTPAEVPAPLVSLMDLERQARSHWEGGTTDWIEVHHPGDRHAVVEVTRRADDRLALVSDRVTFDGATGEVLQTWKGDRPAFLTYSVLIGLHYIWFDKITLRWLYFLMGLAASVMIATGLVLWTVKRRERHSDGGATVEYRIVERINIAVVAGLPVATGAFFWANRLLSSHFPDRSSWEMRLFFLAWSVCAVHAFLRRDARSAWKEELCSAGALFGLLPLLNMATTQSHVLLTIPSGMWHLAGVDLTSLAAGVMLGWTAWRIGRLVEVASQAAVRQRAEAEPV